MLPGENLRFKTFPLFFRRDENKAWETRKEFENAPRAGVCGKINVTMENY